MVLEISPYSGQAVEPAPAAWPDILMEIHWERWLQRKRRRMEMRVLRKGPDRLPSPWNLRPE